MDSFSLETYTLLFWGTSLCYSSSLFLCILCELFLVPPLFWCRASWTYPLIFFSFLFFISLFLGDFLIFPPILLFLISIKNFFCHLFKKKFKSSFCFSKFILWHLFYMATLSSLEGETRWLWSSLQDDLLGPFHRVTPSVSSFRSLCWASVRTRRRISELCIAVVHWLPIFGKWKKRRKLVFSAFILETLIFVFNVVPQLSVDPRVPQIRGLLPSGRGRLHSVRGQRLWRVSLSRKEMITQSFCF